MCSYRILSANFFIFFCEMSLKLNVSLVFGKQSNLDLIFTFLSIINLQPYLRVLGACLEISDENGK